ncbi:hypothetical protein [Mycolicibacterium peregrinum]|uniref:hypothetical protein n=1 Tax=Mycolicibacterium peregrinum TaxID=43304 RepID=UPI001056DA97|nr:hypothetical protein [Mycolicibacterium peregrinum]
MDDPPPGFRESLRKMRWWHWLILIFCGAWAAGLMWLMTGLTNEDPKQELSQVSYAGDVGVPGQALLPSLRQQPVPGWRIDLRALLPGIGEPQVEHIGDVGTRGYFTVIPKGQSAGEGRAWLLGVDVAQGVPSFAPVQIDNPAKLECFLNGATRVLCLNDFYGTAPTEAWVIDTQAGTVLSRSPSALKADGFGDQAGAIAQVGLFAVAYEPGNGWHGIDDQGRFSWTVTAVDDTITALDPQPGMPASSIGVAKVDKDRSAAFSAVDGKLLRKSGGTLLPVIGGFVEQERERKASRRILASFAFFDDKGKRVGRYDKQDGYPDLLNPGYRGSTELPVLSLSFIEQALVLDNRGTPMTIVHVGSESTPEALRFVGDSLYLTESSANQKPTVSEKFNLRSGNRVSSCTGIPVADGFVGSDGTVVLGRQKTTAVNDDEAPTIAVDSNTCTVLWQLTEPVSMWAVSSTLVQALPGSAELVSLVPPEH